LQDIVQDLGSAETKMANAFYEIGLRVKGIEDEKEVTVYGEGAVELLARGLGMDSAELRRFAAVARTWPKETFAALSQRTNARGMALTWEHWMALAQHRGWESWLERTLTECWSVEQLREELARVA